MESERANDEKCKENEREKKRVREIFRIHEKREVR